MNKISHLYNKYKPLLIIIAVFSIFHFIFNEISTGYFDDGLVFWLSLCATFLIFNLYERK